MGIVKSRQRVADHGEVFTPHVVVNQMLDLVKDESERIDSRFLEPACGSGNFLVPVLGRKLESVLARYGRSDFEKRHYGLLALMCVYGIELLADNSIECRVNLVDVFAMKLGLRDGDALIIAAERVVELNIVHGDALTMRTPEGTPITFCEWGYLGKGRFQRRDFRFETLTQSSSFGAGTLFEDLGSHEIFAPTRTYAPLTIEEIARG